ncbi:hypothetical protein AVEN_235769-1 [Araneus ventricosus]|uniref:Uncharacterized protein n=1 Tax=Araneus ventricosus TaxID=182803 RepID=A0A4Y2WAR6_ARAVE|nr:hypothetical protein AVEN_235769-1 [Araneus ventricosus]
MASKRKRLNLKEKIYVLEIAGKEKLSVRSLAERFHIGYDDRDIFNAVETGLFYRILPDKGEKCSSGKISKERLTILLCCNMLGDFETPVVIGESKKPRCFKNIDKAGFLSTSEVATDSITEKSEKELADLVANLDSNVSVEEYVKINDDLSIEEENLHVSNFIHRDTTEARALSEDDDEESPTEN